MYKMKKVFKFIKIGIYLIALGAFIILIIGAFNVNPPKEYCELLWNDKLISVYENDPESFRVYYLSEYEKNYSSEDGKFSFCKVRCIEAAQQWQITVICNDSTVRDLGEKIGSKLSSDKENFTFVLKDQDGNIYSEYDYIYTHEKRHGFRRLVFDGIPRNSVSKLSLCIYYTGDIQNGSLPAKPFVTLSVFNSDLTKKNYLEDDAKHPPKEKTVFMHHDKLSECTK